MSHQRRTPGQRSSSGPGGPQSTSTIKGGAGHAGDRRVKTRPDRVLKKNRGQEINNAHSRNEGRAKRPPLSSKDMGKKRLKILPVSGGFWGSNHGNHEGESSVEEKGRGTPSGWKKGDIVGYSPNLTAELGGGKRQTHTGWRERGGGMTLSWTLIAEETGCSGGCRGTSVLERSTRGK